jgi:hypothetical protein
MRQKLTFKRTETAVHNQLQIAQLALCEINSWQGGSFGLELVMTRGIAGHQVLEDTTVGRVCHFFFCIEEIKKGRVCNEKKK